MTTTFHNVLKELGDLESGGKVIEKNVMDLIAFIEDNKIKSKG
jgi:hypothetical protein